MSHAFTDAEMRQLDDVAARRVADAEWGAKNPPAERRANPVGIANAPEDANLKAMRDTLNEAERRALTRRFTGDPVTGFGDMQEVAA